MSMAAGPPSELLDLGDAYAFIDNDVLMLKSVDRHGDPVELTSAEALRLANWLRYWAKHLADEVEAEP
jgi:hypothetical protein